MDTVAVPDPKDWKYDPFSAHIEGEKVYGRGSADMKGGLAAQAIALIELVEENKIPVGKIRWLVTYGEENGAPGSEVLTDQGYSKDLTALVISEPTSGKIIYAHSGFLNYRIESYGVAAHSSEPSRGVNAISNLIPFLNAEAHLFDDAPDDPLLGKVPHSITIIEGGKQINSIPNYAELRGNIRPTKAFSNEEVISRLKQEIKKINDIPDHNLKFKIINDFVPVETDPKSDFVQFVKNMTAKGFNTDKVELGIIKGGTDASLFIKTNPDLPVVILGPNEWDLAHQTDEYTTLSSFNNVIDSLKLIGENFFTDTI